MERLERGVVVAADAPPLELVIAAWLDAKGARSDSARTRRAYHDALASFREALAERGLDLDSGDPRALALIAQKWAARPDRRPGRAGRPPAAITVNQRLAILSSFYQFGVRRGLLPGMATNPISALDRRPAQGYAEARALDFAAVGSALAEIDLARPEGLRDYALLSLALGTGRRLAELAALTAGDLQVSGTARAPILTVEWRRAKGGKHLVDQLSRPLSATLLAYVMAAYGISDLEAFREWTRDPAAREREGGALWRSLARNRSRGRPLSPAALEQICLRRLGTSRFHALRHTFAHGMEEVGAKTSDIQARLGHASIATTGRYLQQLRAAQNAHGDALAHLLGLDAVKPAGKPSYRHGK